MREEIFDRCACGVMRVLAWILGSMPVDWALRAGAWGGRLAYFLRSGKGVSYLNLKAAFEGSRSVGEMKRLARKSMENLGRTAVEILRLPQIDRRYLEEHCAVVDYPRISEALRRGRGLIFLSAHFGNWELLSAVSTTLKGHPLKFMVREQKLARVNAYLNALRKHHGAEPIRRGLSVKEMMRALKGNSVVALAADQAVRTGVPVRFFGRLVPAPAGPVTIAARLGSTVLPVFDVREKGKYHRVHVLSALDLHAGLGGTVDEAGAMQKYYDLLEDFIRRYPDQWLWEHKRWKFTRTKTMLILTDGKAGHEAQSKTVADLFEEIRREDPSYEFRIKTVQVVYRSSGHRAMLTVLAPFLRPWIRGRIGMLRHFLTEACFAELGPKYADFVISCGSGLVPVNLLVATENHAKSIVLMKPSFPFRRASFDLVLAPRHDEPARGKEVVYTDTALNPVEPVLLAREARKLAGRLRLNGHRVLSVFIGGDTRRYALSEEKLGKALARIFEIAKGAHAHVLVTTSRRTRPELARALRDKFAGEGACRLFLIASEGNIPNVTYGMIGLGHALFVTEDSLSMVSEAASSGKKVVVLRVGNGALPAKHERFHENLAAKRIVTVARAEEITGNLLSDACQSEPAQQALDAARAAIKAKLIKML
jgi:KDO2-lipid IV(A) lauroyltransferase